ncbi:MAG: prolipoprotein diacylglyceryl transferase [Deltaproteobacteria bacterium]|nr:prolipoprotein diacylglyceryl transferase [Deltaproteobacteria bacterium]
MQPILFEYGPIQIRFYGLMYVIAILVGTYLIKKEVKHKGVQLTDDNVMNFIFGTVLAGIIGARLYYVVFNLDYYLANPKEIPAIWHGGLAFHGGLIGGLIFALVYLKRHNIEFWRMADIVAPAIILGQAFGRFGNFMNGDAHGMPTTMPWGIVFPKESIAGAEFPNIPLHPVMLYEMAINLSIFFFLWFGMRKHAPACSKQGRGYKDGFIFALYLLLYSIGRFIVENFRADSLMLGYLRTAQVVSILVAIAAVIFILKYKLWATEAKK